MMRRPSRPSQDGSALISTLLVITVLTIIIIAFLQSMSLERKTARSYLNRYKASLAAEAGEADAISVLLRGGTNLDTYSITETNFSSSPTARPPTLFLSVPSENNDQTVKYTPLVSGGNPDIPPKPMGTLPSEEETFVSETEATETEPQLPPYISDYYDTLPEARWVYLKDEEGENVSRYCYWVEDLQGRLDAQLIGNTLGAGSTHRRGYALGTGEHDNQVGEIGLFTFFDSKLQTDSGGTDAQKILENREKLLTGDTIKQLVSQVKGTETDADDPLRYFYYGLGYENAEPDLIPYGYGFVNAGLPKMALNQVVPEGGNETVTRIAEVIDTNLPNFAEDRRGGMNAQVYSKNLAASIIDYADPDNQSTTDGVTYRGMDSFPLIRQWFRSHSYSKTNNSATFILHYWVEVWNMSDKSISGTIRFVPNTTVSTSVGGKRVDFSSEPTSSTLGDKSVTLLPNEKKVIDLGINVYTFNTTTIPPSNGTYNQDTGSNYQFFWQDAKNDATGFQLVDRSIAGIYGPSKSYAQSSPEWYYSIPSLTHRISSSQFLDGSIGDPRATFFINALQDQSAYGTRACVGGRTRRNGLEGRTYGEVRPSFWPDPGFDEDLAKFVGGESKPPTAVAPTPTHPDWAMAHYGNYNDSEFRSITELGNVYDFGQWRQYGGQESQSNLDGTVQKGLSDITNTAVPDNRYGGGYTLRIGRPEFSRFDNPEGLSDGEPGYRARARSTDLLGIFSTEPTHSTRGLVNINTASRDVLRALGAGITMTSPEWDRGVGGDPNPYTSYSVPEAIYGPSKEAAADLFADAVINNRPFYSQHELAYRLKVPPDQSSTVKELLWGNPNVWPSGKPTVWRDAAAEEYLRQIYDLVTVRSRNFRIHVTGQVLGPKGNVISTSRRIADVYLQPVRDEAAPYKITSQIVKPLYEITY